MDYILATILVIGGFINCILVAIVYQKGLRDGLSIRENKPIKAVLEPQKAKPTKLTKQQEEKAKAEAAKRKEFEDYINGYNP